MAWSGRLALSAPTLADVAERAGVSRQTVSNAREQPRPAAPRHPRPGAGARSRSSATRPTGPPATCGPGPRHLVGLRFDPAQEGTAYAAMDRFVHSLVESSGEARLPHPALLRRRPTTRSRGTTTSCARPPSTPSSSPTPTSATRRRRGSTSERAPFVAFGRPWDDPEATHPWVDVDGARRRRAGHRPPARPRPHPDRLGRLAQGLLHRGGPAQRLGRRACTSAACPPPGSGLAGRGHRRQSGARPPTVLLDEAQPTAFVCASDTIAMGVLQAIGERGASRPARRRRRRLRRLPGRPRSCRRG